MKNALSAAFVAFALGIAAVPAMAESDLDKGTDLEVAGLDLYQKGDLDGAIAKYRDAMVLMPNDRALKDNLAAALNDRGVKHYAANDYAEAIKDFQEALNLSPGFAHAKQNLGKAEAVQDDADGLTLYKAGNIQGAADKYGQAVKADPSDTAAHANLANAEGDLLSKQGDFAGAVAKYQEALSYAPNSASLQAKLAKAQDALAKATPTPPPPAAPAAH